MRPSFIAAGFGAIIMSIAFILYIVNYKSFTTESNIKILLLASIAFSFHALHHHIEEIYYDYNPLVGKWLVRDDTYSRS